jgi:L-cysteine/cystine lyase
LKAALSPELARARRELPLTAECNYLSTGSYGPYSRTYSAAVRRIVLEELQLGRMAAGHFEAREHAAEQIRHHLAQLCQVRPEEIALMPSTSAALDTVIRSFAFGPGDEVVCTQLEHQACTAPLAEQARRLGFSVRIAHVPEDDADDLGWLLKCVTPRTRLIAFTGVSYMTGQRLPLAAIGTFARAQGITTLLDAAQCIGAMPLDLAGSGIDFCGFPLQKWLLGPDGLGGLYVREGSGAELLQDRVTHPRALLEATVAHLDWLQNGVGWQPIFERTLKLATRARERLAGIAGLRVVTPAAHAGLVAVDTAPEQFAAIAARARRRRIVMRSWPELGRFRLSTAFFNTDQEIAAAIRLFRS